MAPSAHFERLEEVLVVRSQPDDLVLTHEVRPPDPKPTPRAAGKSSPSAR